MTDPKVTGAPSASARSTSTAVDDPNSVSAAGATPASSAGGHPGPPPVPVDRSSTTTNLPPITEPPPANGRARRPNGLVPGATAAPSLSEKSETTVLPPVSTATPAAATSAAAARPSKPGPRSPSVPSAVDQYAALTAAAQTVPAQAALAQTALTQTASAQAGSTAGLAVGPAAGSAEYSPPKASARQAAASARAGRRVPDRAPRRARLQLRHLNVWSVLKFSCVLALALFLVWLIMIAVLYGVLDQLHVFSRVNDTVRTINGDDTTKDVVTSKVILYGALIIGMVNMVLFIVLSTIGSLVYNLCADMVGGIEVTLAERD